MTVERSKISRRRANSSSPTGWCSVSRYSFSGSIPPKFEHKLRRHKQRFGKLPPQLYQIKMKICYDQGCNDIGVVIATK